MRLHLLLASAAVVLMAGPATAQTQPQATPAQQTGPVEVEIDQGVLRPLQIAVVPFTGQNGPQITAIFNQVYPNWILPCDIPGADQLRIQVELTLSADGRITRGPSLINAQSSNVYRAAADGALRALRQTAPFDVPQGFPGGVYRPTFNTERACRNR